VQKPDSGFDWLKAFLAMDLLGMKITFYGREETTVMRKMKGLAL